jgi:hypothetical protein
LAHPRRQPPTPPLAVDHFPRAVCIAPSTSAPVCSHTTPIHATAPRAGRTDADVALAAVATIIVSSVVARRRRHTQFERGAMLTYSSVPPSSTVPWQK